MSFILEALKKSEQQRQQQNSPSKKVQKRILSLQASPYGSRLFPWLVSGLLSLIMFSGWWYYIQTDTSQTSPSEVIQSTNSAHTQKVATSDTAINPPRPEILQPEIAKTAPETTSAVPQPAISVEPAPVPRSLGSPTTTQSAPLSGRIFSTADRKIQTIEAPVETVVIAQPEPQELNNESFNPDSTRLPLYSDLSNELRNRIAPVNMSMHFYNKDPDRSLVRINDRLLREGDWVSRELELVEITPAGVILGFNGKIFELHSAR
ncbi:general secretion pathway protein GspB [Deltaproteobacteria bacterium IMCC39524]|nr:general secretion pathway protein GspB [Deltaproteobacteria bacterium IMCC39524]